MEDKIRHPWQRGPAELIQHGIFHLHSGTDFDYRMAFLLLDIGVESLFKTFLVLPDQHVGSSTKYSDREKAAKGKHFELVQGIREVAQQRLNGFDLDHIQHYHRVRNQLYHQWNDTSVQADTVYEYAELAVGLLERLLKVDLKDELTRPDRESQQRAFEIASEVKREAELESQIELVRKAREDLANTARLAIAYCHPRLSQASFEQQFRDMQSHFFELGEMNDYDDVAPIYQFNDYLADEISKNSSEEDTLVEYYRTTSGVTFPDGVTQFRLQVLQHRVDESSVLGIIQQELSEFSVLDLLDRNWGGLYVVSDHYPEVAQMPRTGYDDEPHIFPTHEEVLEAGQETVNDLRQIQVVLERWIENIA